MSGSTTSRESSGLWDRNGGLPIRHIEHIQALIAGDHHPPWYVEIDPRRPRWIRGELPFGESLTEACLDGMRPQCGKERLTTLSKEISAAELRKRATKKTSVIVCGSFEKDEEGVHLFVEAIVLPTRGIPKREYEIVIDPEKTVRDQKKRRRKR